MRRFFKKRVEVDLNDPEVKQAYSYGEQAWDRGFGEKDNPYAEGDKKKKAWQEGYRDKRSTYFMGV